MAIVIDAHPATQDAEKQLLQRAAELEAVLRWTGVSVQPESQHEVLDFKDLAAEDRQALLDTVTLAHAAEELEQVREAQRRLRDGSYGTCQDCGEPIAAARLRALPATPYCTHCQALRERPALARA